MIDLARLDQLVTGQDTPANLGEEVFLKAYTAAVGGDILFVFLLAIDETLDELNLDEMHLLVIGYAMGQHDLEAIEMELTGNDKINLH